VARPQFTLLLKGGTVFTPLGEVTGDIGIDGERIATLGAPAGAAADEVIDATGLYVLPGMIDSQVHFREPGLTHKEDIHSGSLCAAFGGVTTFFEMPNTKPPTTTPELHAEKVKIGKATSYTDFGFYLGATKDNAAKLGDWEDIEGCCGVKCFLGSSTGTLLVDDEPTLLKVLRSGKKRVACHSEDEARLKERKPLAKGSVHSHPVWRDEEVAVRSTAHLLGLAEQTQRRVHVLHVSTAGELPLLKAHKSIATCEVTPQHLTLVAPDCYDRLGTKAQMNPPLRDESHRSALWAAVNDGLFDVMGSDHAPHTLEEKAKPYPESPSGMPGVQTMLPVMLDHVAAGRTSLSRVVDLLAHGPSRIFGLRRKGAIEVGRDADFVLVDLKAKREVTKDWLKSKCGWSPFEGVALTGWPMMTILRGKVLVRDGQLVGSPGGKPVLMT
jgi:dihydroorotase